jgi:uncharacterized protein
MSENNVYRKFLINDCSLDVAHDIGHIERVVKTAGNICSAEGGDSEIVITAAWLHDCVTLPKDHPERSKSSILAGKKAAEFLHSRGFPKSKIRGVVHAIEAHSYSAGIEPKTIEAKIVQDADRLDALGAIGIARCLLIGGNLGRPLYDPDDPFCEYRSPDDSVYTIDHFYEKLFKLPDQLHTNAAKKIAVHRTEFMKSYLNQLKEEI